MSEIFEFIDCPSISIALAQTGLATLSFTVVSTNSVFNAISNRDYTQLTFGGIDFKGFITELNSTIIPASIPIVYEHKLSLIAIACASNCPRGPTRPA